MLAVTYPVSANHWPIVVCSVGGSREKRSALPHGAISAEELSVWAARIRSTEKYRLSIQAMLRDFAICVQRSLVFRENPTWVSP